MAESTAPFKLIWGLICPEKRVAFELHEGDLWVCPFIPQRQEIIGSGAVLTDQPVLQVSSSSCGSVRKGVTQTPKPRQRWRQSAPPR